MGPVEERLREQARLEARVHLLTMYRTEWTRRRRELMRCGAELVAADDQAQSDTVRTHLGEYTALREQQYQELSKPRPGRRRKDVHAELAVDCAQCGADVGVLCRTRTGRAVAPHASRLRRVGLKPVWAREDVGIDG